MRHAYGKIGQLVNDVAALIRRKLLDQVEETCARARIGERLISTGDVQDETGLTFEQIIQDIAAMLGCRDIDGRQFLIGVLRAFVLNVLALALAGLDDRLQSER